MSPRRLALALLAASTIAATALGAGASASTERTGWPGHGDRGATLLARGILPAEATAPAPFPGIPNTDPAPAPGATQPVGGFSALISARGHGYWAMPDNGFGNKANSRSFLLRVYRLDPELETPFGGEGAVGISDWITLSDPDEQVPFEIVNEDTDERLLTGGDFDIESMRVDRRGDLWFGDEFGPFLLHTDVTGRVLEAPIPLPDVKSADYPADFPPPFEGPANLNSSNGFEGMALSADGRKLYPTLEGAVIGDEPTLRRMYEFDLRSSEYTGVVREYRVADPSYLVSDLTALDGRRLVSLERDNFEGAAAAHKRAFVVDLRRRAGDGSVAKAEVADLLDIADPFEISEPARPGDVGIGNPFAMPYVTIESVLPLGGPLLGIVNDTNFGSRGRNPGLPDYSDFIVISAAGLHGR